MCYSIYTQHKSIGEPATNGNPWRCRSFFHSMQGTRNKRSGMEAVFYFTHRKQLWGNIYLFCLVGFLQCSFLSVFWMLLKCSFPPPPSLSLLLTFSLLKENQRKTCLEASVPRVCWEGKTENPRSLHAWKRKQRRLEMFQIFFGCEPAPKTALVALPWPAPCFSPAADWATNSTGWIPHRGSKACDRAMSYLP